MTDEPRELLLRRSNTGSSQGSEAERDSQRVLTYMRSRWRRGLFVFDGMSSSSLLNGNVQSPVTLATLATLAS